MNRTAQLATVVAAAATLVASSAFATPIRKAAQPVEGRYIVVLRDDAVRPGNAGLHDNRPTLAELSDDLASRGRGQVRRQYGAALKGFAFEGDAAAAAEIAADARVAYVAEDGWAEAAGQASPPSWGLDRVDQHPGSLDAYYEYYADGAVVDVYIVDTGIRSTHVDFQGRVDLGASFSAINDGWGTEDCHGHGTAVAGIVGGATYGVAKNVTLHPVRVLDCNGRGMYSDIVAGVDWITARYTDTTTSGGGGGKGGGGKGGKTQSTASVAAATGPAVVNMSLSTNWAQVIDEAVSRSIAAGITYVVAAGNGGYDSCLWSPARVPEAITVGSSNSSDAVSSFSNVGACIDLYAPGEAVVSSYGRSDTDTVPMSGTSLSAPHVAGTAALLLSINPALTPAEVATLIGAATTQGALSAVPAGAPNRLLFTPFTGFGVDMAPVAEFTSSCSSGSCTFDAAPSVDDRGILDYSWDFGNGKTGTGERVSVRYGRNAPAFVTVTLTITDTVGQTTVLQKEVRTAY